MAQTTNIQAFELARDSWARVGLADLKATAEKRATEFSQSTAAAADRRRSLVDSYKIFRNESATDVKMVHAKGLIKALMKEIDTLTVRTQTLQHAHGSLVEQLQMGVDPVRLAELAIQCVATVDELQPQLQSITAENVAFRAQAEKESLRASKLQQELNTLQDEFDEQILEKGQALEDELNDRIMEIEREAASRESHLQSELADVKEQRRQAEARIDDLQNDVFNLQSTTDDADQVRDRDLTELTEQNSALEARTTVLTGEIEQLRQQLQLHKGNRASTSEDPKSASDDSLAAQLHNERLQSMKVLNDLHMLQNEQQEIGDLVGNLHTELKALCHEESTTPVTPQDDEGARPKGAKRRQRHPRSGL